MRNRNSLVIFIVMALTLLFVSQALAQVPIEGWDKAKFGMSPEELREVYSEEEQYYKDEYYQKLEYIEKYYSRRPFAGWERELEQKKNSHGEYKEFWKESEECWSREDGGVGHPHALSFSWFETPAFGKTWVDFEFVEDKLYSIKMWEGGIHVNSFVYDFPENYLENEIEKNEQYKHKLAELEDALTQKYGHDSERKVTKSERQYDNYFNKGTIPIRIEVSAWTDGKGNTITLERRYELFSGEKESYDFLSGYGITYLDKGLTERWEEEEQQWKIDVAEWKRRGEELRLKGLESF